MADLNDILSKTFGYDSFRPGQEEAASALAAGRDVFAIMPTGAGKSICYQVPALACDGITIVVSPLIALMHDQVQALVAKGVRGAYLNSTLSAGQQETVMRRAYAGTYKIIYVTPERLERDDFRAFASHMGVSLLVVDEAHCISQWGGDFRPAYSNIGSFARSLPKRPPIAAFTATATSHVKKDIEAKLELSDPVRIVAGFDRPNLHLAVAQLKPKQKDAKLITLCQARKGQAGIVYCVTRKETERVAELLTKNKIKATFYHGGMAKGDRERAQNLFMTGACPIIVATSAFGMGVDKRDVRFVVCYQMPPSVEDYYQQIGRAGRDGQPAKTDLFWCPGDINTNKFLINQMPDGSSEEIARWKAKRPRKLTLLNDMIAYCEDKKCLRAHILRYFGEKVSANRCDSCTNCDKKAARKASAPREQREIAPKKREAAPKERERAKAAPRTTVCNADERKADFVSWFSGLEKPRGGAYKESTIRGYTERIETACLGKGFEGAGYGNLFEIDDPERLEAAKPQIVSCRGARDLNERTRGGFTAALNKYLQYLRDCN